MKPPPTIQDRLSRIGKLPSAQIRLADTALFFATALKKEARITPYIRHLKRLCFDVAGYAGPQGMTSGEVDDLDLKIEALRQVLCRRYGYGPAGEDTDRVEAANMMYLIDSRLGTDCALAILYVHIARALDWTADAIDFPGRILVRLEHGGRRVMLDPCDDFRERTPKDLRRMLKDADGAQAELTPAHYLALDNRSLVLNLQEGLKTYLLDEERFFEALDVTETELIFAPDHALLWLEAGLLYARLDQIESAVAALEKYLHLDQGDEHRYRTSSLLQELRARLN